eukprot:7213296-Prymnesium_polylepis.1
MAGFAHADAFRFDGTVLLLAPNASITDDMILTQPFDIVLRPRTSSDAAMKPTVAEELKATECVSKSFWAEYWRNMFVEPTNLCYPHLMPLVRCQGVHALTVDSLEPCASIIARST